MVCCKPMAERNLQVSREDLIDLTETRIGIESLAIVKAVECGDARL